MKYDLLIPPSRSPSGHLEGVTKLLLPGELIIIRDAKKALEEAIKSAKPDDLILVTGSLYLVGEIKRVLCKY